jgi:hypothetical protein
VQCINLLERFGSEFKVGFDEANDHRGVPRRCLDPWMMTLVCKRGLIYPQGGSRLAAEVDNHPGAARQLAAIPGVTLTQDGTTERTFVFDIELFPAVAAVLQPRRRRRMSEAQRTRLREAGAGTRFRHGVQVRPDA